MCVSWRTRWSGIFHLWSSLSVHSDRLEQKERGCGDTRDQIPHRALHRLDLSLLSHVTGLTGSITTHHASHSYPVYLQHSDRFLPLVAVAKTRVRAVRPSETTRGRSRPKRKDVVGGYTREALHGEVVKARTGEWIRQTAPESFHAPASPPPLLPPNKRASALILICRSQRTWQLTHDLSIRCLVHQAEPRFHPPWLCPIHHLPAFK